MCTAARDLGARLAVVSIGLGSGQAIRGGGGPSLRPRRNHSATSGVFCFNASADGTLAGVRCSGAGVSSDSESDVTISKNEDMEAEDCALLGLGVGSRSGLLMVCGSGSGSDSDKHIDHVDVDCNKLFSS